MANDNSDLLAWIWLEGDASTVGELLDPVFRDPYVMCLYDQRSRSPALLVSTGTCAGGTRGGKSCWKTTASGRKFKDADRTQEGAMVTLRNAGDLGQAEAPFKDQGD